MEKDRAVSLEPVTFSFVTLSSRQKLTYKDLLNFLVSSAQDN